MGNGYYPLIPGGRYYGPVPDNYTGEGDSGNDPYGRDDIATPTTWRTADGQVIPIVKLDETHLLNIQRACRAGSLAPQSSVVAAIEAEVVRRKLTPLTPYESRAEALTVAAVSSLYVYWKRVESDQVPDLALTFALIQAGAVNRDDDDVMYNLSGTEQRCVAALFGFREMLRECSPEAQKRCLQVYATWAASVKLDAYL